jgi:hypothetical protein
MATASEARRTAGNTCPICGWQVEAKCLHGQMALPFHLTERPEGPPLNTSRKRRPKVGVRGQQMSSEQPN